ncbi:DUF2283 domain-containing protein [Anaeroselena agilis]|uniref:DUF2283 domain-containing protein n=1 Tax=Anaeroselena agilis TaxID=3063788 RepID=UPI0039B6EC34
MNGRKRKLTLNYDTEHDILYVSLGTPRPSYCSRDVDGILIRNSFNDGRFSGVTIMDFSKRTKEQLQKVIPVKLDIENLYSFR